MSTQQNPTPPLHPLLSAARPIERLRSLPPALYTTDRLVGAPFEQIVVAPSSDAHRVLFTADVCDCVCVGIHTNDGTRILAHKQLDRGSVASFVRRLLQCVPKDSFKLSSKHTAKYVLVGGHDDTRHLVNSLVATIDALTQHRWSVTRRQLFGVGCTRSLAMVGVDYPEDDDADSGLYNIDFERVPLRQQRIFSLESMLSIRDLSIRQRNSLMGDLRREREEVEGANRVAASYIHGESEGIRQKRKRLKKTPSAASGLATERATKRLHHKGSEK